MFFSSEIGIEMQLFTIWHLLQIGITLAVVYLIFHFKDQLRTWKHEKRLRYVAASLLILLEVSIHIWQLANGLWSWRHALPLDLCTINIYLAIYMFFTKQEKLFYVIYFWGLGAVLSVLFPDMSYGPDRYRYYQFFYAHMMFLWMYVYMVFVHDYRPNLKHMTRSCIILFVLAIGIVLPIDFLLDENYMFVVRPDGTPLELIYGYGQFLYTSGTVLVIYGVMWIWYAPIYIYLKRTGRYNVEPVV